MRRRDLLIASVAIGTVAGISPMLRWLRSGFDFSPMAGFEGFRKLGGGAVSSIPGFLVGLTTPSAEQINDQTAIHNDPCAFLFGPNPVQDGKLPIAIFSDYFCPYCAVLSRHLIRLEKQRDDIRLIVHELPLLGPRSLQIAKVALAAKRQGVHLPAHGYLMDKVLRPGPVALRQFAENLKLDPDLLQSDMESLDVAAELRVSRSLASALGIIGTPATMIGRTLAIGAIPTEDIVRLVDLESQTVGSLCS